MFVFSEPPYCEKFVMEFQIMAIELQQNFSKV